MKKTKKLLSLLLSVALLAGVLIFPAQAAGTASDLASVAISQAQGTSGTKYRTWFYGYDKSEAWCAIFVSWCANQAGIPTNVIPRTAGVEYMRTRVLNAGGKIVTSPQAGDLIFYYNYNNSSWAHVGIMRSSDKSVQGNVASVVQNNMSPTSYTLKKNSPIGKNYKIEYIRPNYSGTIYITVTATTKQAEKQSNGSYTLYGSAAATGAKITQVGMYIGTSGNTGSMTKLGSDSTNSYSPNMWYNTGKYGYTLKAGTTYYYRAYAVANGKTVWGDTATFTTAGTSTATSTSTSTSSSSSSTSASAGITHTHVKGAYQFFEAAHPHHSAYQCSICGAVFADTASANLYASCKTCNPCPYGRVTTGVAEKQSNGSYTLRGSVSSPGYVASEVGMYLGTATNNLTKLGSDVGTTKGSSPNMWYNTTKYGRSLSSGTTYYYQAYAVINGVTHWGDIKSFKA